MLENAAKPNSIINVLIIIALYSIFWVIVTVVLPIISIVLRLHSKESQIINDQTPDIMQDMWTDAGFFNLVAKDCFSFERSYWSNLPSLSKSIITNKSPAFLLYGLLPYWSKIVFANNISSIYLTYLIKIFYRKFLCDFLWIQSISSVRVTSSCIYQVQISH